VFTLFGAPASSCTKSVLKGSSGRGCTTVNLSARNDLGTRGLRMARFFRAAILMACLLYAGSAFAAGGTCPSGANYLNSSGSLVTLASLGVTNCYYIAANGNDSNNGTSESAPWLHAPGMATCTSTCAGVKPAPGEGFIFRGGDTWHTGNPSTSPYVGTHAACSPNSGTCDWLISWNGSNGSPIYWGVDQTWYSGGSWARPLLTGDNPTSSTGVASCAYDETKNTQLKFSGVLYNTVDNFEFTGTCWNGNNANINESRCCTVIIDMSNGVPSHNILENVYVHGWTHATFSCSLTAGEPTGSCDGAIAFQTASAGSDLVTRTVLDGADTDGRSMSGLLFQCYDVEYSVFRYNSNAAVCGNGHIMHDDLFEYIAQSGDGVSHGNAVEFNNEWNGTNAFYNIVLRHLWQVGANEVTWWTTPAPGNTDYEFNFLMYDICPTSNSSGCTANGNFFDVALGLGQSGIGTVNAFNMTWAPTFSNATQGPLATGTVNWHNNQCIQPGATSQTNCYSGGPGKINYLTNVIQTPSTATTQGYTASETYAYAPTASGSATVGTGTNEQAFCTTLLGSSDPLLQAAGTACKSGTTYACSYDTTNHTVSCPGVTPVERPATSAWDVGANQYSSLQVQAPQGQGPQPPTNLRLTVQ
jgi:hypothetical protein